MTPAELRAWVAETRSKQGLAPTITDATTLAKLAALVADTMMLRRQKGGDRGAA
jgi:hypothetical protein